MKKNPAVFKSSKVRRATAIVLATASFGGGAVGLTFSAAHAADQNPMSGKIVSLAAVDSGKVVDKTSSGGFVQWTAHGGANQQFKVLPSPHGITEQIQLQLQDGSGKCLIATPNHEVEAGACDGRDDPFRFWRVAEPSNGEFELLNWALSDTLAIENSADSDGAKVIAAPQNSKDAHQRFRFFAPGEAKTAAEASAAEHKRKLPTVGSTISLHSKKTGKAVEVDDRWVLQMGKATDEINQKFVVKKGTGAGIALQSQTDSKACVYDNEYGPAVPARAECDSPEAQLDFDVQRDGVLVKSIKLNRYLFFDGGAVRFGDRNSAELFEVRETSPEPSGMRLSADGKSVGGFTVRSTGKLGGFYILNDKGETLNVDSAQSLSFRSDGKNAIRFHLSPDGTIFIAEGQYEGVPLVAKEQIKSDLSNVRLSTGDDANYYVKLANAKGTLAGLANHMRDVRFGTVNDAVGQLSKGAKYDVGEMGNLPVSSTFDAINGGNASQTSNFCDLAKARMDQIGNAGQANNGMVAGGVGIFLESLAHGCKYGTNPYHVHDWKPDGKPVGASFKLQTAMDNKCRVHDIHTRAGTYAIKGFFANSGCDGPVAQGKEENKFAFIDVSQVVGHSLPGYALSITDGPNAGKCVGSRGYVDGGQRKFRPEAVPCDDVDTFWTVEYHQPFGGHAGYEINAHRIGSGGHLGALSDSPNTSGGIVKFGSYRAEWYDTFLFRP